MTYFVPPQFPSSITPPLDISSSNPIRAAQINALSAGANYLWGRGQQLVPDYTLPNGWCVLTSGKEYYIALRLYPKKSTLERTWGAHLTASYYIGSGIPQSNVTFKVYENHSGSRTTILNWNNPYGSQQDVVAPEKYTVTGTFVTASILHTVATGTLEFSGLYCWENTRNQANPQEFLKNPDRTVGSLSLVNTSGTFMNSFVPDDLQVNWPILGVQPDLGTVATTGYPLLRGPYPTMASVSGSALHGMRKAGQVCIAVPYAKDGAEDGSMALWTISGSATQKLFNGRKIPINLRHIYGSPTGNNTFSTCSISFFHSGSRPGVFGSLYITGSGGQSLKVPMSFSVGKVGVWMTASILVQAENPANNVPFSYAGDGDMGWIIVSGALESPGASQNISFYTVQVGEPGNTIL